MFSGTITKRLIGSSTIQTSLRKFCEQVGNETNKIERSMNQVNLIGRTGNDPQKRGTDKNPVVIFSLATNVIFKQEGQTRVNTDWHRICIFKPYLRDMVYDYLKKGQRVYVTGRISYGELEDEDGTKKITSIIADDVIFFQS